MKNPQNHQTPKRGYVPPKLVEHGSIVEKTLGLPQGHDAEALSSGFAIAYD